MAVISGSPGRAGSASRPRRRRSARARRWRSAAREMPGPASRPRPPRRPRRRNTRRPGAAATLYAPLSLVATLRMRLGLAPVSIQAFESAGNTITATPSRAERSVSCTVPESDAGRSVKVRMTSDDVGRVEVERHIGDVALAEERALEGPTLGSRGSPDVISASGDAVGRELALGVDPSGRCDAAIHLPVYRLDEHRDT